MAAFDPVAPGPPAMRMDRRALLAMLAAAPACLADAPVPQGADAALAELLDSAAGREPGAVLDALKAFPTEGLSTARMIEYWAVRDGLDVQAELVRGFAFGSVRESPSPYVVSPRSGAFTRIAAAAKDPDGSGRVARLERLADDIDRETARIQADAAAGVVPPRFILDATLKAMAPALAAAAGTPAARALDGQRAALEALRAAAAGDPGVWRLKDGATWYALALAANYGERVSPAEAHRAGLAEVASLQAEADGLLRGQGLTQGSVGERLRALSADPRWLYADDDAGRERAVLDMNARLDRARARLGEVVRDVPPGSNTVRVRRMSPADEARGRAGYREAPPWDGSRPGGYFVDLHEIRKRPAWTLPSVVHHELLPGHLLQLPFEARARPHPFRAHFATAYSEAWGVYAERLADEMGLYEGDPLGRLGYLQWRLFRIGRLAADTGVHVERWSRERAIAELNTIQGGPIAFISIEEDVERMCVSPGQVAAQALGAERFASLREQAKTAMGVRFDPSAFHQAMLAFGPLPFATAARVTQLLVAGRV